MWKQDNEEYIPIIEFAKKFNRDEYGAIGLLDSLNKEGCEIYFISPLMNGRASDTLPIKAEQEDIIRLIEEYRNELNGFVDDSFIPLQASEDLLPKLKIKVIKKTVVQLGFFRMLKRDASKYLNDRDLFSSLSNWINEETIKNYVARENWSYLQAACLASGVNPELLVKWYQDPKQQQGWYYLDFSAIKNFPYVQNLKTISETLGAWIGEGKIIYNPLIWWHEINKSKIYFDRIVFSFLSEKIRKQNQIVQENSSSTIEKKAQLPQEAIWLQQNREKRNVFWFKRAIEIKNKDIEQTKKQVCILLREESNALIKEHGLSVKSITAENIEHIITSIKIGEHNVTWTKMKKGEDRQKMLCICDNFLEA